MYAGRQDADVRSPVVQVPLQPDDAVARQRLHHGLRDPAVVLADRDPLLGRDRVERRHRPATLGTPGELGRSVDGRLALHLVQRLALGLALRRATDAAGVEELVDRLVAVTLAQAEPKELGPLEKERPLLAVERLLVRQVDDRGVGLDLAEVREHRGRQRQALRQAVAQVQPQPPVGASRSPSPAVHRQPGDLVGKQLEPSARRRPTHPFEGPEAPDARGCALGPGGPIRLLRHPLDESTHLPAPAGLRVPGEAQLAEGDTQLGRPPVLVDRGPALPDGIPVGILEVIVVDQQIALHADRVDEEDESRPPVVVRVDGHPHPVGWRVLVTSGEQTADR